MTSAVNFFFFFFLSLHIDEPPTVTRQDRNFRGDYTRYVYSIPTRVRANPLSLLTIYFVFFLNEIRRIFQETNNTSLRIYPEMVLELERQHIDAPPNNVEHHLVLSSLSITLKRQKICNGHGWSSSPIAWSQQWWNVLDLDLFSKE